MNTKIYKESIKNETKKEIELFLKENPETKLSYWDCRKAWELACKASDELRESISGFAEEFDIIFEEYREIFESQKEILIFSKMREFNYKMADLYNRLRIDEQASKLISQLWVKRYW